MTRPRLIHVILAGLLYWALWPAPGCAQPILYKGATRVTIESPSGTFSQVLAGQDILILPTTVCSNLPAANSPGFVIDFDINPSPFGGGNPFIVETYGGYAYSQLCPPIASYTWNFGDGTPTETSTVFPDGEFVTHRYVTNGNFTVTYRVTDHCGGSATTNKVIAIPLTVPRLAVEIANQGESISVSGLSTGWDVLTSTNLSVWTTAGPGPWPVGTNEATRFYRVAPAHRR